ncbi:MAG: four helix bundle protein [Patescibacteria group bacterium]|nr:four helix bundle protein [Patescibacteria group bacterium]
MKKQKITSFTDLEVWKLGHELVLEIYRITKSFPKSEIYGLTNQMRRASVSITSNIAEGFGRKGYKEKIQFYYHSIGSLIEIKNQILIAKDLKYFKPEKDFIEKINSVHKLLNGLITASKKRCS